jgi:hypothetical protein
MKKSAFRKDEISQETGRNNNECILNWKLIFKLKLSGFFSRSFISWTKLLTMYKNFCLCKSNWKVYCRNWTAGSMRIPFYKNRNNDIFIFRKRAEFNCSFWSYKIHRNGHLHSLTLLRLWLLYTPAGSHDSKINSARRTCLYFCTYFRTNSDHFPVQNQVIGFCNREGVCTMRGRNRVFKNNSC